ncbi:MAG TPA: glucose-6-phosphate dehydrogenase assembly protein OpcA [Chthoniobacterales bacterium]|nr:glucose-6-phosphate dehydrogenase assembly protein OpcA [Chthoniobacterales bacterium]
MVAPTETFAPGIPVEIGKIDRALKKLWTDNEGVKTRASLINLAIYSEAPGSLPQNTEIISKITENHACRAIVIGADPGAKENRVEAWISAHCHVSGSGSKQVCSEQLSFLLEGPSARLLPNIVFSHLDSDLPFYLWWQEEFHEPMDPQLWAWVDRVIYDSQKWRAFDEQMQRVETAQAEAQQRIVLCDLNWTRLDRIRLALAQFFDRPASLRHLREIESVEIDFAPGYRSTGLLLAGWLAGQLEWTIEKSSKDDALVFRDEANQTIRVSLSETKGEPISRCVLKYGSIEMRVSHSANADLLEVSVGAPGQAGMSQPMPASSNDPTELMKEELMRCGWHRVYLRAMNVVRDLL